MWNGFVRPSDAASAPMLCRQDVAPAVPDRDIAPDPRASHFPEHWRTMRVVAFGQRAEILNLEKQAIDAYASCLVNSQRAAGTGTSRPLLFLYVCSNDGPGCHCIYCREGRDMSSGYTSSSEEEGAMPPLKRVRLGLRPVA